MGLDIYVKWYGMGKEEEDAQIAGFSDAVDAGYLRYAWWGVSMVREYAEQFNVPDPLALLWSAWNGSNGEEFSVTPDELKRLIAVKDELLQWLAGVQQPDELDETAFFHHRKVRATVGLISFIEAHKDKPDLQVVFG